MALIPDEDFKSYLDGLQKQYKDQEIRLAEESKKQNVYDQASKGTNGVPASFRDAGWTAKILEDILPHIGGAIRGQYAPEAVAQAGAADVTNQAALDFYKKYGPQLNQVGSDIQRQNALNEADTNQLLLTGKGRDATLSALNLDELVNPEFYANRAATGKSLKDLTESIDLTGGLSETERREIEQGLAREGNARGTYGAPSSTETIANAIRYGNAGRARVVENQNQLSKAIAASTAFLPASQSPVNSFAVGTGKTSGPNTGDTRFSGVPNANLGFPNAAGNQLAGNANTTDNNAFGIQAGKKDWLDEFVQFSEGLKNTASAVGSVAGAACWVARLVYGITSPRWIEFREWMLNKAPADFRNIYLSCGEAYAEHIKDNPNKQTQVRLWMDKQLGY